MKRITRFFQIALVLVVAVMPNLLTIHAQDNKTLTVFAASSLTDAFNEVKTAFEQANPGVTVTYSYGASSTLATQLTQDAPADIFASANAKQMQLAVDAKRVAGTPRTFAKNRLVLIVPADNPAKISNLKSLATPGIKLVIAAKAVPVRDYTDTMLDKLVQQADYGPDYKTAFMQNVVSEEADVRQVSAKVALGEADAGFVYRSDVTPDIASKVTVIQIPDVDNTIATYPIAVTNTSAIPDIAQKYIDYVLSDAGQRTLVKWNFISADIPPVPASITIPTDGALHVGGQVLNPLKLTSDDLKNNFTAQKVDATYPNSDGTTFKATFTGVYLRDILDAAELNFNPDVKSDSLSLFIVATGKDGYQSVIAYGEVEPNSANQPIMIAYLQDGNPILDHGPLELVVPGDKHGARYVADVVSLEVWRAPTAGK